MREFFRGWKQKFGVATLVMACVFAVGWARSFVQFVRLIVAPQPGVHIQCDSVYARIEFVRIGFKSNVHEPFFTCHQPKMSWGERHEPQNWLWHFCGIGVIDNPPHPDGVSVSDALIIAYRSIVIPLTLLSAWLLLSKARQRQAPVEPIPEKDA